MHVSKWDNSLAVRLPAAVVEALGLKEGDDIEIRVEGARMSAVKKTPGHREVPARPHKYRGRLPDGFVFDRLEVERSATFSDIEPRAFADHVREELVDELGISMLPRDR